MCTASLLRTRLSVTGLDSVLLTPLFKLISESAQDAIFRPPEALRKQLLASSMAPDAYKTAEARMSGARLGSLVKVAVVVALGLRVAGKL
jgi:hypothetical protein